MYTTPARYERLLFRGALFQGFVPPDTGQMTLGEALQAAIAAVENHIQHSPHLAEYLRGRRRGTETHLPNSDDASIIKFLAQRRGEIDASDPEVWAAFTQTCMTTVFRLRERALKAVIESHTSRTTTVGWANVVKASFRVAEFADTLWLRWSARLVVPYRLLSTEHQQVVKDDWAKVLPEYDYTVPKLHHHFSDTCALGTWRTQFPCDTGGIVASLGALADAYRAQSQPEAAAYVRQLARAHDVCAVDQLEPAWAAVDEAWIKIPRTCPLVPVHGMENGEVPNRVSPEFRLALRITSPTDERMLHASHDATLRYIDRNEAQSPEAIACAKGALQNLDAGRFADIVIGGSCLGHANAGQNVPNRAGVRSKGGKVFIVPDRQTELYAADCRKTFQEHCVPETVEQLLGCITSNSLTQFIVTHEDAHVIGRTAEIDRALGDDIYLVEEAKASLGGVLANRPETDSAEYDRVAVANTVARLIRWMDKSRLTNPGVVAYVRENIIALELLSKAGVVDVRPEDDYRVRVYLDPERVNAWFGEIEAFITETITIYGRKDVAALREFRIGLCGATDRGSTLVVALLNRRVNKGQAA